MAPPLLAQETLRERLADEDPVRRAEARADVLARWDELSSAELDALSFLTRDASLDVAAAAGEIVDEIALRRRVGPWLSAGVPGLRDAPTEKAAREALTWAASEAREGRASAAEIEAFVELVKSAWPDLRHDLDTARELWGVPGFGGLFAAWLAAAKEPGDRASLVQGIDAAGDPKHVLAVLPLLNSEDRGERYVALSAIRRLPVPDAKAAVLPLLAHSAAVTRSDAAGAVLSLKATEALPRLRELLKDPEAIVRSAALEAIVGFSDRGAVVAVRALLADAELKHKAVLALCSLGAPPPFEERLQTWRAEASSFEGLYRNPSETTRKLFGSELSESDATQLLRVAAKGEAAARTQAIQIFQQTGHRLHAADIAALFDELPRDGREQVLLYLWAVDARSQIDIVRHAAADDQVRSTAAALLCEWRDEASYPLIRGQLNSVRREVVAFAGYSLADAGDLAAAPLVRPLLQRRHRLFRKCALTALDRLDSPGLEEDARRLLADAHSTVRLEAARVLGRCGGASDVKPLLSLLKDEDQGVLWAAATALVRLGEEDRIREWLETSRDG